MNGRIIRKIDEKYIGYLSDQTAEEGFADSISFPETESDAIEILLQLKELGISNITVQGARTGLKGKAVPHGGHIINGTRMNAVIDSGIASSDSGWMIVQAGITLRDLHEEIRKRFGKEGLFWPPAPSEESATVGGIVLSEAYGMNYAGYGKTINYISGIRILSAEGNAQMLTASDDVEKYLRDTSEFKLITELSLIMIRKPEAIWGAAFFFTDTESAASFADSLQSFQGYSGSVLTTMEFIDRTSIDITERARSEIAALHKIPRIPDGIDSIVYIEAAGNEEANKGTIMHIVEIAAEYGADPETAWALFSESEAETMRSFRHAVTEAATLIMAKMHVRDSAVYLQTLDLKLPDRSFSECLKIIRRGIRESKVVISACACICDNMFRLCIMAENENEMEAGHDFIKRMISKGMEII